MYTLLVSKTFFGYFGHSSNFEVSNFNSLVLENYSKVIESIWLSQGKIEKN